MRWINTEAADSKEEEEAREKEGEEEAHKHLLDESGLDVRKKLVFSLFSSNIWFQPRAFRELQRRIRLSTHSSPVNTRNRRDHQRTWSAASTPPRGESGVSTPAGTEASESEGGSGWTSVDHHTSQEWR